MVVFGSRFTELPTWGEVAQRYFLMEPGLCTQPRDIVLVKVSKQFKCVKMHFDRIMSPFG